MVKLNTFALNRALTALPLRGDEDSEEISKDADTDDLLRSLAASEMIAPKFRWRRSRWGRLCPVELYNGNIVHGQAQYAVRYSAIVNIIPILYESYCIPWSNAFNILLSTAVNIICNSNCC